jgi:hypothetical protein
LVGSSSSSTSGSIASARTIAARCLGCLTLEVDAELAGNRFGLVTQRGVVARQDVVFQRGEGGEHRLLFEQHDPGTGHDRPSPLVGLDRTGDRLEQGRLAGAVAADQRQPVARADMQVEMAEQPARPLNDAKVFVR